MDALEDYNSEEDEDYVPGIDADDDFAQSGQQAGGKGKGTKRKRGAAVVELSAPKRVPLIAKVAKKKGPARIGAAVLSDDDDDFMQRPRHDAVAEEEREEDGAQQRRSTQREEERKESESHTAASGTGSGAVDEQKEDGSLSHANGLEAAAATHAEPTESSTTSTAAHISTTITPPAPSSILTSSPSSTTPSTSSSSATQPSSSPLPTSSKSTASAKGGDLASILAQFNKKPATAKPAIKKVINPWELPTKPKPTSTPTPAPSTTPPTPSTTATTTVTATPSAATAPVAAALSNEQVVVSDITSYAGETIQITKTLIRGSPEELAHRAATHSANNLTTLLSSLTSRQSINTLEKSRIDWSVSKQEEGDEDELRRFVGSKEALVDRMAFLARAERREWEKVKEVREAGKKQTMTASTEGMDGD